MPRRSRTVLADKQEDLTTAPAAGPDAGELHVTSAAPGDCAIRLEHVSRTFKGQRGTTLALNDISLDIPNGQFLSVVGPSGCGKSTLLGLVAGLSKPDPGSRIDVLGQPVAGIPKDIGYIFQQDALLPWRTALQNVALPLEYRGASRAEARRRAGDWLERVGLAGFSQHYPHQLSGGMRKRVAIAASLSYEPSVLLMDEPFGALDVQTRTLMENDLLGLWDKLRPTVIFITHDLEEAVSMSDRVIVMGAAPGRIIGDYTITLERPRNLLEIRFDEAFVKFHHDLWQALRGEVIKARGRQ